MMIVWGTQLYGRVDRVDGLGHIATEFGHLFWIPLFPSQSYLVLSEDFQKYQGIPVATSGKSILAGYGFAFSIIFILMGLGAFGALNDPHNAVRPEAVHTHYGFMILAVLSVPLLLWLQTGKVRKADYERACEMALITGDDRVQVYVDHHFGKISDEEADRRIEILEAAGFNLSEYDMPEDAGVTAYAI